MADLLATLRSIAEGLEHPSFKDVAKIAQELLAKQVRTSWESWQDQDENPWVPTKRPSFAGVLKSSGRHLLDDNARGDPSKYRFYGKHQLAVTQSFLSLKAIKDISSARVSDKGFETPGNLPKYWSFQDEGTTKTGWGPPIPARPFWGFGDDLLDLVAALLADRAAVVVAEK